MQPQKGMISCAAVTRVAKCFTVNLFFYDTDNLIADMYSLDCSLTHKNVFCKKKVVLGVKKLDFSQNLTSDILHGG